MSRKRGVAPYFPASTPRAVEDGLRVRSARGAIGVSWWSKRFIEVLEQSGAGSRLQRGRSYARKGQVAALTLDAGMVTASVQGSRARPYRVRLGVTAFDKGQWAAVEEALANDAWFVASLLAGEMPPDIEEVFTAAGLALFPRVRGDLTMDCSCPDWEVPCKHLAAVCYLLAERFDDDPFELLAWRGREREDLLERLELVEVAGDGGSGGGGLARATPLDELLDSYFSLQAPLPVLRSRVTDTYVPDQLPPVHVSVRSQALADVLRPAYALLRR